MHLMRPGARGRRAIALAGAVLLAGTAAGCGSGGRPHAAEPATAPATHGTPAGLVRPVGAAPEGIVHDPVTGLVAVAVRGPDRLLLLDPTTLAVRRSVPLPGSARHLQLSTTGDEVLVPAESANELVEVPLAEGAPRATAVRKQPHDATRLPSGDIAVGDEFGKTVSIVRDGRVRATITGLTQPGGVASLGGTLAVVDVGAFTVSTYDTRTLQRTGRIGAGAGPTHIVVLDDRLVVTDTRGGAVLVFATDPLRQVGRLRLPGAPYGIAAAPADHSVWVTLTGSNQLVGLRLAHDRLRVVNRYHTVRQPNTVAVDTAGRSLWVTGTTLGVAEFIHR